MLYPAGAAYWAFDNAALTGNGLAAGMTPNPDPNWTPGNPGLSQAQIDAWVNWYVGGLDNVTNWQMQTLNGLGFNGYYETVTPGSGTRPDGLAMEERFNLPDDGTTGMGAVWDRYYAMLPDKTNVIAYISSVADNSGGNDGCQPSDATRLPQLARHGLLVRDPLDRAIANQNGCWSAARIPATASPPGSTSTPERLVHRHDVRRARAGPGLRVRGLLLGPRHHLWDGTLPFSLYADSIARYATAPDNLGLAGTLTASNTQGGFPAGNANDNNLSTYWQAAEPTAALTLQLARPNPVDRVLLELPQDWPTREQTIEVDGSGRRRHLDHPRACHRLHLHRRQQRGRHPGPGTAPRTASASTSAETPSWGPPRLPNSRPTTN